MAPRSPDRPCPESLSRTGSSDTREASACSSFAGGHAEFWKVLCTLSGFQASVPLPCTADPVSAPVWLSSLGALQGGAPAPAPLAGTKPGASAGTDWHGGVLASP